MDLFGILQGLAAGCWLEMAVQFYRSVANQFFLYCNNSMYNQENKLQELIL